MDIPEISSAMINQFVNWTAVKNEVIDQPVDALVVLNWTYSHIC